MTREAAALTGIEISREAVADAAANARRLGVAQTRFAAGAAARLLPGLLKENRPEVVFIDPPRAGCTAAELAVLSTARPERIVYCSCDPATFARDAKILLAGGYCMGAVQPVDMFPWTSHVELVGVFIPA
jgi:23S rRNA (uracil1939-C5)-methyltransferase